MLCGISISWLTQTQLDSVKSATPAVGEEQIIDIELDKRTVIDPSRPNHTAVDSKAIWDLMLPTASPLDAIATIAEEPSKFLYAFPGAT